PAGRRHSTGSSAARFSPSSAPVNIVYGVNTAGNTRIRRTARLVNTVNIGMLGGREAPLPPAGLQPEDSGRPLILPAAYGEAGERYAEIVHVHLVPALGQPSAPEAPAAPHPGVLLGCPPARPAGR